jgi:hypothetical protein
MGTPTLGAGMPPPLLGKEGVDGSSPSAGLAPGRVAAAHGAPDRVSFGVWVRFGSDRVRAGLNAPGRGLALASSFFEKDVESALDHLVKEADAAGNPVPLRTLVPL